MKELFIALLNGIRIAVNLVIIVSMLIPLLLVGLGCCTLFIKIISLWIGDRTMMTEWGQSIDDAIDDLAARVDVKKEGGNE